MSRYIEEPCIICKTSTLWEGEHNGQFVHICPLCSIQSEDYPISQYREWIQDFSNRTSVYRKMHQNSLLMQDLVRAINTAQQWLVQDVGPVTFVVTENLQKIYSKRLDILNKTYAYQLRLRRLLTLVKEEV